METKIKNNVFDSARNLYEGRELVLNAFKIGLFLLKSTKGKGLKMLTPKANASKITNSSCTIKSKQ